MYYQGRVHCTFPLCTYKIHGDGPPPKKKNNDDSTETDMPQM